MLHRGPVVITTLEEDFKKIGLLKDEAKETESEEDAPTTPPVKTEAAKKARHEDDDEEEGGEDETDDADDAEEAVENSGDEIDEARRIAKRVAAGTRGKLVRTKRTTAAQRVKAKRLYRKSKAKIKLSRRKKMRKASVRRRMKFLAAKRKQREGSETIANLIEDVQSIIGTIDFNAADAVKSFANIAIISDMLSGTFTEWSNDLHESAEEGDETALAAIDSYAESLADLAEAAAEAATSLKDGQMPEGGIAELEAVFKEYMTDMLEGMDLYNDLVEQPNTMHGAKGKTVASEEDEEGDEDEDDEDEAEESKRPSKR